MLWIVCIVKKIW